VGRLLEVIHQKQQQQQLAPRAALHFANLLLRPVPDCENRKLTASPVGPHPTRYGPARKRSVIVVSLPSLLLPFLLEGIFNGDINMSNVFVNDILVSGSAFDVTRDSFEVKNSNHHGETTVVFLHFRAFSLRPKKQSP
jgi:hypothetical protein